MTNEVLVERTQTYVRQIGDLLDSQRLPRVYSVPMGCERAMAI